MLPNCQFTINEGDSVDAAPHFLGKFKTPCYTKQNKNFQLKIALKKKLKKKKKEQETNTEN
jgi:hypothetical protein